MLTQENDVEIHALAARGWNQSAISRHTGRDRKTVRKYLAAGEEPARERGGELLGAVAAYIAARFVDDPHLPAVTLLDELAAAGFDRSYPTLVRELRRTGLRPVCLVCQQRRGNVADDGDRPPGRRGDPVGLARAARHAVGAAGVRAGRRVVALGPVPGGVLRADDVRAPGRRAARDPASAWAAPAWCGGSTGWRPR